MKKKPIIQIYKVLICSLLLYCPLVIATNDLVVIDENWLTEHINDEQIVIVDVREKEKYLQSHITNAVNIPVSSTFSKGERTDLVAPLSEIKHIIGQAGISNSSHVVLYDSGSFIDAARVFWVLEVFGQSKVSVLNLGFKKWQSMGLSVDKEDVKPQAVAFIPAVNPDLLATSFQVRLAIDNPNHVLIDARPAEEYMGLVSKTKSFGHIPSAINVPSILNIDQDGLKLQAVENLLDIYGPFDKEKPITVYCNKGKESALVYYVLRKLGYKVSAYDGSWYEWSNSPKLPITNPSLIDTP